MHRTGRADDLFGLQMPGNKADAVPCGRLRFNRDDLDPAGDPNHGCLNVKAADII